MENLIIVVTKTVFHSKDVIWRNAHYWCHFHILDALREFCAHYMDEMQKKQKVLYTTVNIELCALIPIAFHTNVIIDQRHKNQMIGVQRP